MFMYILPFTPWNQVLKSQLGPWTDLGGNKGIPAGFLARRLAGGEGQVGKGLEEVEPHLLVALARGEVV